MSNLTIMKNTGYTHRMNPYTARAFALSFFGFYFFSSTLACGTRVCAKRRC